MPMRNPLWLFAVISLFCCCGREQLSQRLKELNTLSESNPIAALDSLDAIDKSVLDERNANYYDFLTVKSRVRGFKPIESDSLILQVVDYAKKHKSDGYYPEALYTAGRVYVALGDLPTAMEYYQQALEILDDQPANTLLKAKILSQTGRLLATTHLYDEATAYLQDAIEIFVAEKDTMNSVLTYQLLGSVFQNMGKPEKGDSVLHRALDYKSGIDDATNAVSYLHIGIGKAMEGNLNQARSYLRRSIDSVSPYYRNSALAHAARIYRQAEIYDTAYIFAKRIIDSPANSGKASAYEQLLSPELRKFVPSDSIGYYYDEYTELLSQSYNENSNALVIQQQAAYNYRLQQQKRLKAEASVNRAIIFIGILCVLALLLAFGVVWFKYQNKKNLIKLQEALDLIHYIRENELPEAVDETAHKQGESSAGNTPLSKSFASDNKKTDALRRELQCELHNISKQRSLPRVGERITNSEIYSVFVAADTDNQVVPDDSTYWEELEKTVLHSYPNFKRRLELLSGGNLKRSDYRTALLIKCGFSAAAISRIVGRKRNSIKYRTDSLSKKFFDTAIDTTQFYKIIRIL
ncbi:MAG: hypothetical protein HDS45_03960 [Bacteroides sp.]|nr:hypothetical protein [Bacteroides sp.]